MEVRLLSLEEGARQAEGPAIIIDVFRAFTCAPILFHLGVEKIIFVSKPDEGLALKRERPDLVLIGEVNAAPIEGYDFGNSPKELLAKDKGFFAGKTAVQRTSSGVQGTLIALERAEPVLLAGYVTARATAEYVKNLSPAKVSIIAMGRNMEEKAPEDELCARYIASLLGHGEYDHREAVRELVFSPTTRMFTSGKYTYMPAEDPIVCLQRDLFDLVIRADKEDGLVTARPVRKE
jgi:2-phosphosulfolactate phosphatase